MSAWAGKPPPAATPPAALPVLPTQSGSGNPLLFLSVSLQSRNTLRSAERIFDTSFFPIPFCSLWQIGQNLNRNFYKTRSNPVSEFISFCPVICSVPPTHAHIAQAPKEMFSSARALLSRVSAGAHRLRIFLSAHSLPGSLGPAAGSRCLNCCLLSKANLLCGYEIWGRKWHQRCFNNFPKSNKSACGLSLEFIE